MYVLSVSPLIPGLQADASAADLSRGRLVDLLVGRFVADRRFIDTQHHLAPARPRFQLRLEETWLPLGKLLALDPGYPGSMLVG